MNTSPMHIHVFGKHDCAKCESTRHKLQHYIRKLGVDEKVRLTFIDMDTVDGMAEGAFRDVHHVPTTIIERDGDAMARWSGMIPASSDLKQYLGKA
ncbi:MAG: thioredoxin family protein [bacterium]